METAGQLPETSSTAAQLSEGSHPFTDDNEVPIPTMELYADLLLHLEKVGCMLEFGCRFVEYSKVYWIPLVLSTYFEDKFGADALVLIRR